MKTRLKLIENFDPTPEETALAERAKPIKLPLCIKCKLSSAMPLVDTAQSELKEAFLLISNLLTSQRAGRLSREHVEKVKLVHKHLCRASRARYCQKCFDQAIEFSNQTVKGL